MRQRLGIARALVNDPAVVFLDEPTLGLDPAGQRQVLGTVRTIAERGATVILSTHILPEVEEICTSVLILDQGKAVAAASVGDVTAAAAAPRTARLRVPAARVGPVREALAGVAGLRLDAVDDDAGALRVSLCADSDGSCEGTPAELNDALRAVLRTDTPVLSFEVEGARLSDAFLTMTREGVR
jgi:ABC-2 type transport system ATP-binding protein